MSAPSALPFLTALYHTAIRAVQPARALEHALASLALDAHRPTHLIAVGKAASTMCAAAHGWCTARGVRMAGGVCVTHAATPERVGDITTVSSDHPVPGDGSEHAAAVLQTVISQQIRRGDQVLVLLSGGASALLGAPVETLDSATYRAACAALLRSGLDIHAHNTLRRQLSRWGNGRLASAVHAMGADVTVLAISDVPGDVLSSIGSAPCLFTPAQPDSDAAVLRASSLTGDDAALVRRALHAAAGAPVTPFASVPHLIISSNRLARAAVVDAARTEGVQARNVEAPIVGDAHTAGARIAEELCAIASSAAGPTLVCWGGEPTLAVPAQAPAGGRMQALALAAARVLHDAGDRARGITLLAVGSDGRDGTTDAAGAGVDATTWGAITAAGLDPAACLAQFDSHRALQRVGCCLPAFVSGTNVNDLVLALVER